MTYQEIWGGDRFVLYLPAATQTLTAIDGSREKGITKNTEKFLTSPRSAWNKHPEDHVWQVRDLGSNTRAFATWCQNHDLECEAFIVQDIYKKANEDEYWGDINEYDEAGRKYDDMFSSFTQDEYDDWIASIPERDGIRLVLGE